MSEISPKPIISRVVRAWTVPPGLTYALALDVEGRVWVIESCRVGTQMWTPAQAEELPRGPRTRRVLEEALRQAQRLEAAQAVAQKVKLPRSVQHVSAEPRSEASPPRPPAARKALGSRRRASAPAGAGRALAKA